MAHMRALIDDETFDLMEHRRMRLIRVTAIGAARNDHADRRLLRHHRPDLHRACMGAQQLAFAILVRIKEERIVHLARRMAERKIQRGKIIKIIFDIGTFRHRKTHIAKNRGEFFDDLADRMDAATRIVGWLNR